MQKHKHCERRPKNALNTNRTIAKGYRKNRQTNSHSNSNMQTATGTRDSHSASNTDAGQIPPRIVLEICWKDFWKISGRFLGHLWRFFLYIC